MAYAVFAGGNAQEIVAYAVFAGGNAQEILAYAVFARGNAQEVAASAVLPATTHAESQHLRYCESPCWK